MNSSISITEIEIVPVKPNKGLVAFASCVVDRSWYMGSIAVYTRPEGGYRLVYPTRKVNGKEISVMHPISSDVGKKMEAEISNKVKELWDSQIKLE